MKTPLRFVFSILLSLTIVAGTGSVLHAVETPGPGQEVSLEDAGAFISLMVEGSRTVEQSKMTVEGNLDELDGAPEADLETTSKFVAEQYELVKSSPQSVTVTDRAHTSVNDHLVLCLEMEPSSDRSKLSFGALKFCQGLGTNLLHKLSIKNHEGETLATYTLDSFEE